MRRPEPVPANPPWVPINGACAECALPLTLSAPDAAGSTHSIAILSRPTRAPASGICVMMLSGGLQARTGAHRMFTTLARALASEGHSAMRFDWPGLGDANGDVMPFEDLPPLLEQIQHQCLRSMPGTERVVWLGLCDGASVALLHLAGHAPLPPDGLILLNPWVRSDKSEAQTVVRHYYRQRLLQGSFWRKLLNGRVGMEAVRSAWSLLMASRQTQAVQGFQQQMAHGWNVFRRPVWLVVADQDLTGLEFIEHTRQDPAWHNALQALGVEVSIMAGADHTFSGPQDMPALIRHMTAWLSATFPQDAP